MENATRAVVTVPIWMLALAPVVVPIGKFVLAPWRREGLCVQHDDSILATGSENAKHEA
jgi:hypothetical protein